MVLVLIGLLFASCSEATQVEVRLRTNVPYANGSSLALWSSRSGSVNAPLVETTDPWLADGEVGNVVVTPGEASKTSSLTVRVAMGLRGKRAADCTDEADAADCIVARRKLAFVPNTRLLVPVVLHLACEGVKCTSDTTCSYLGQCVSAQVNPSDCAAPEGCTLPGDPPFAPGLPGGASVDAAADVAQETVLDSAAESGTDAGDSAATEPDVELVTGVRHTCVRLSTGAVKCWGRGLEGQLGLGDAADRGAAAGQMGPNLPPVSFGPGIPALQLAAGQFHTCARVAGNSVRCWGTNGNGQLGLGDVQTRGNAPNTMGGQLPSVDLGPARSALDLAAGSFFTCARLDDGAAKCWGTNGFGQLGVGDTQDRGDSLGEMGAALPTLDMGPGRTIVQLSAGGNHACARLDNGQLKCWGRNLEGQLGLGDSANRGDGPGEMGAALPAVDLGAGRTCVGISAAALRTCALLDDGTIKCWGQNAGGELGLGDTLNRGTGPGQMGASLPAVNLGPGRKALEIATGTSHSCARLDDGSVRCWGGNPQGQLGLGDIQDRGAAPGHMGAALPAVDLGSTGAPLRLSLGGLHTCALLSGGAFKCWGFNGDGQLGLGDDRARGDAPGEMGAALPFTQVQ